MTSMIRAKVFCGQLTPALNPSTYLWTHFKESNRSSDDSAWWNSLFSSQQCTGLWSYLNRHLSVAQGIKYAGKRQSHYFIELLNCMKKVKLVVKYSHSVLHIKHQGSQSNHKNTESKIHNPNSGQTDCKKNILHSKYMSWKSVGIWW